MYSSSNEPRPLGARIYAAKLDTDCNLSGEWMMVASPITQSATFYAVRSDSLFSSKDHAFGNPAPFTTPRFVVKFSDLANGLDEEDQGACIIFPQFREDLEGRRFIVGEVMIERERLINLIRTVGLFSLKNDEEWTERVMLVSPEMDLDEEDTHEASSFGPQMHTGYSGDDVIEDVADMTMSHLASMHIAAC